MVMMLKSFLVALSHASFKDGGEEVKDGANYATTPIPRTSTHEVKGESKVRQGSKGLLHSMGYITSKFMSLQNTLELSILYNFSASVTVYPTCDTVSFRQPIS